MLDKLNHVAIVVPDLEAARAQYRVAFGANVSDPQDFPSQGVRIVMITLSNTRIELLHPLGENSPIQKFLARNPMGGIHHLCFEVPDIVAARDQLMQNGIAVIGDGTPTPGYDGCPVLFFDPKNTQGSLIELKQAHVLSDAEDMENPRTVHHGDPSGAVRVTFDVDFDGSTPQR